MASVSRGRGARKRSTVHSASDPSSKSPKVSLLSPTLLLMEIPAETNTSVPVWDAIRSQQVNVSWTVNPYSVSVSVTPAALNPNRNEGTSITAQTVPAASSNVQPQLAIHSLTPLQSSPPNNSCVLLTFNQTNSQVTSSTQVQPSLNLAPAASLIVNLPLIITQLQPTPNLSTSVTIEEQPALQSSTCAAAKSQKTLPKTNFHTKNSIGVRICDNFLLNMCCAGEKCEMHHTQYPFHWQFWCVTTHKWIDIPPNAQILLEKIFCNVSQTTACIRDGKEHYILNFDSMELNDHSKYDGVRRLVNSDSPLKNPHFPAKCLFYWWNNYDWEKYSNNVSELLLNKMKQNVAECSFYIDSKEYKVNFTTMKQINVNTGFERDVRCRPLYRSPDSMQPFLKTVTHEDPSPGPPGTNFNVNALEDFTSWYPPVWCLAPEQDYSLVDVPAGTKAHRSILSLFFEGTPETRVDVISVQQVQNSFHWDKYQRQKIYMMKKYPGYKEPLERHLFHGTTKDVIEAICQNNFDPRLAGVNGTSCGHGTYFAINSILSNSFAKKSDTDEVRHMFLAKVLVGKSSEGRSRYRRPPVLKSKLMQHALYDSCVDSLKNPTLFVVFDSCQCYPYYLIKYRDMQNEVKLS